MAFNEKENFSLHVRLTGLTKTLVKLYKLKSLTEKLPFWHLLKNFKDQLII